MCISTEVFDHGSRVLEGFLGVDYPVFGIEGFSELGGYGQLFLFCKQ